MEEPIKEIRVILESKDFIAVAKPAGLAVHQARISRNRGERERSGTLVDWLRLRYPEVSAVGDDPAERPGIVHRLDKDTSGVLIIARTQPFYLCLKKQFQEHVVKKSYLALVWGTLPKSGVIDKPIGLKPGSIKHSTVAKNMKMVKPAVTEFETLWTSEKDGEAFTFVRLEPRTGRTHQLRVHLASIGHPIVGDPLYSPRKNPWQLSRQYLHAEWIEFGTESGKRFHLACDLPEDLDDIAKKLNPD
jgi:23S rRNA pseudouridine1911/1915/1917 synthase